MSSKVKGALGKSLIKDRFGGRKHATAKSSDLHTTDLKDGVDWNKINLKSVTEENTLDEFLSTAELAMTEFVAERQNAVLISNNNMIPTHDEMLKTMKIQNDLKSLLRVPRRPEWNENTSVEKLNENEKKAFLEWRHSLSKLSEVEGVIITPYEKNLEFWRQLWRVIERSDIIVQIVDARNPLLFRCEDLEIYAKEIDSKKENVLLVNKADFLNESQRKMWVDYFKDSSINVLFWSAINELNKQKDKTDESEIDGNVDNFLYETNPILSSTQLLNWFRYIGRKIKSSDDGLVTVGLIGYPNVGKSSTINALLAHRVIEDPSAKSKHYQAPVSATPGKTKHFQTFYIDNQLMLCDCPGLVMPNFVASKAEMVTNGILPADQMKDFLSPTAIVCGKIPRNVLESMYGIMLPDSDGCGTVNSPTPYQLLTAYARIRGFMTHKGIPDCSRAARLIVKDFVNGKLCYCTCPPNSTEEEYGSRPVVPYNKIKFDHLDNINADECTHDEPNGDINMVNDIDEFVTKLTKEKSKNNSKKHFNKNKREKLRRLCKHLDA